MRADEWLGSAPVNHMLEGVLSPHTFAPVVTRDFRPPKPHPAGVLHIAAQWGLDGAQDLLVVGDSVDDLTAGFRAGAATVLLLSEANAHLVGHAHADMWISRLDDLVGVLDGGFVGRVDEDGGEPKSSR